MSNKINRYIREYTLGFSALLVVSVLGIFIIQSGETGKMSTESSTASSAHAMHGQHGGHSKNQSQSHDQNQDHNQSESQHKNTEPTDNFIDAGPFAIAVSLTPETPGVGDNHLVIHVIDNQGRPVTGAKVRVVGEMAMTDAVVPNPSSQPLYAQANISETEPGIYQGNLALPLPGNWPIALDIATDEAHHVDLSFDLTTGQHGIRLIHSTPVGEVAYHTCSMHPSVKSAAPGTCPICGMELIAVTKEQLQSDSITIDEGRRQIIGVKTGQVIKADFALPIHLHGHISYDETRLQDISLRFDGWIGELNADFEGKRIGKGDILFTVYSPELLSLQEEYLETLTRYRSNQTSQRKALLSASRKRLLLWGLESKQIQWLEQQRQAPDYVPIFSPQDGVVIRKQVVAGSAFMRGQQLLQIADLSTLWIESYAYEQDLPLIQTGMDATVQLSNQWLDSLQATVMQVDPFLDNDSRTARVRLQIDNSDGRLQPGLFASVILRAQLGKQLLVPEDAVLVSGDKRVVFLDIGQGRLKPVLVRTGYSDGQHMVIRRGLKEGDAIVTSGNFLVAAESRLRLGVEQW